LELRLKRKLQKERQVNSLDIPENFSVRHSLKRLDDFASAVQGASHLRTQRSNVFEHLSLRAKHRLMGAHSPEPEPSRPIRYGSGGSPVSEIYTLAKAKRKTERKIQQQNLINELQGNTQKVQEVVEKLNQHDEYKRSFSEAEAQQPYRSRDRGEKDA